MEKSPEAFRTIREVADAMDLPQHVLRFWETRFPQIRPLKRAGGRRYYRPDDVERLKLIKRLLYDEGYTIKGVQKLFKEQGAQALTALEAEPQPDSIPPVEPADRDIFSEPRAFSGSRAGAALVESQTLMPGAPIDRTRDARLTTEELASLRGVLVDLEQAERMLIQARAREP